MSDTVFTHDVFLSHSAKDKAVVRALAERLRTDGLRVWFDEWEIHPGDSIPAKIEEGLEHSRVLVLCMSAHAFGSDWAQLEAGTFRFRDPLNRERRFIPLRLDAAPIKGSLAQFLYINWLPEDREQEYTKLLEACRPPVKYPVTEAAGVRKQVAEKAIQLDSKAWIFDYAFSPDGKRVLTGADDKTVRLWDLETGRCLRVLKGHTEPVWSIAWDTDQRRVLSAARDNSVRLWDVKTGRCLRVLEGHTGSVHNVAWSGDQRHALSGSNDNSVRLWDVETGRCLRVLEGHTDAVWSVAWSADQRRALSSSEDNTVRLWDMETGRCLRVFEGHTDQVLTVIWTTDQRRALSGSSDETVRLWDIETGRCLRVLEGESQSIACSADGRYALSCRYGQTVYLLNVETGDYLCILKGHTGDVVSAAWSADQRRAFSGDHKGGIRVWDLSEFVTEVRAAEAPAPSLSQAPDQVQYTNAKVLLVGESGAGKTGLTMRLTHDRPPQRNPSTSGAWSTQWPLKDLPEKPGWEREVWLWDFGGQADQRLIHQLYLDRTALVLLLFNADQESVLPGLREWQQALARSVAHDARTFLVAGRTDVGFRFDREKVRAFARENGYEYFETSAETAHGIFELRKAMLEKIPWDQLTPHNSPALFKKLKDEILKLRDEGLVLATFKELESVLRNRLPSEVKFADAQLGTVVSLLDGPGVVKELGFGTYVLLRPEWINAYAQAVIRTLRAAESGLGCLPVRSIMEGKLIFQTTQADGKEAEEKRLGPDDERVVLQAMEQMLLERRLCLRQGGDLVFPSHCGLERPVGPVPPKFFVSYTVRGFLDDIYATLVAKLAHCGAFKLKELWRDAADFETLAEGRIVGIKLVRREDGRGELLAHHARGVSGQEQVIFASYIHEHLSETSTEEVPRLRFYTCPHCDEPVKNRELAMERLEQNGEGAEIRCQRCDKFVPLWDALEKRFSGGAVKKKVEALRQHERDDIDSRRLGKLLVHEVSARITSANQKCHEIPGDEDEGIDLVVEFTDDEGRGTGKHMYLQLKAGNSHLRVRKSDGAESFTIKKQSWVKQWIRQDGPVMLVIGTFPEERERGAGSEKKAFAEVRWTEIADDLKRESDNGRKPVKRIVFKGERLDALSVRRWRDRVLGVKPPQ
ncbi:MAG: TIR domain-containing protein [Candidatus Binatia bacterium]